MSCLTVSFLGVTSLNHCVYSPFVCAGTLTLQQLLKALKKLDNWFVFGVILGVPVPQLKKIESSYSQRELERCKIDMLQYWLDNKLVNATWNEVIQALEQTDQLALASEIKREYLWSTAEEECMCMWVLKYITPLFCVGMSKPGPESSDTSSAATPAPSSSSDSLTSTTSEESKAEIEADIAVVSNLKELEASFGLMLVQVKRLLVLNKCDLSDALLFLNSFIGSEEFNGCST